MSPRKKSIEIVERIGVIYARYSSHNQKEESIEQQVEECMAFAALNHIKIIQVYSDKTLSSKTDKRPQFQKMMRDAEKGQFTVVVAYKSNRIARNMLNALSYEDKLGRFGIETLYTKEEFGNTAAGRFALRTMMNVNQFYSENMAEDIRRGMRDNAENCKVNGALPLGYVNEQGIPPILEKEVFYAMQRHLDTKKDPRRRHRENYDYLLTGKLHCGYCKSFMVGISGTSKTGISTTTTPATTAALAAPAKRRMSERITLSRLLPSSHSGLSCRTR